MKVIKPNIYTQSEYAKHIGKSQPRVNQMMKENNLPPNTRVLKINGAELIEVKV